MHSANSNLASNCDRHIILSPFWGQCSLLSYRVKTSIFEFPTYASFGGGGSHMWKIASPGWMAGLVYGTFYQALVLWHGLIHDQIAITDSRSGSGGLCNDNTIHYERWRTKMLAVLLCLQANVPVSTIFNRNPGPTLAWYGARHWVSILVGSWEHKYMLTHDIGIFG